MFGAKIFFNYKIIVVFLSAIIIVGFFLLGLEEYQNHIYSEIKKGEEVQAVIISQQSFINKLSEEIESLKRKSDEINVSTTKLIVSAQNLEEKINNNENETRVKEESSLKKISEIEEKISGLSNETATAIKEWRPRVALIVCNWKYPNGTDRLIKNGSGFIFGENISTYSGSWALTNKHVFLDQDNQAPDICSIKLPENDTTFQTPFVYGSYKTFDSVDMGLIKINSSNQELISLVSQNKNPFCEYVAEAGERMAILGYPSIGTVGDITATEGIISGHDGDFYITSAKIEFGNSGGIAVSTKNNCILGIPTFVKVGQIETLGRILTTEAMFATWGVSFDN